MHDEQLKQEWNRRLLEELQETDPKITLGGTTTLSQDNGYIQITDFKGNYNADENRANYPDMCANPALGLDHATLKEIVSIIKICLNKKECALHGFILKKVVQHLNNENRVVRLAKRYVDENLRQGLDENANSYNDYYVLYKLFKNTIYQNLSDAEKNELAKKQLIIYNEVETEKTKKTYKIDETKSFTENLKQCQTAHKKRVEEYIAKKEAEKEVEEERKNTQKAKLATHQKENDRCARNIKPADPKVSEVPNGGDIKVAPALAEVPGKASDYKEVFHRRPPTPQNQPDKWRGCLKHTVLTRQLTGLGKEPDAHKQKPQSKEPKVETLPDGTTVKKFMRLTLLTKATKAFRGHTPMDKE